MSSRILISGASIAGNTAAWLLGRLGNDVTVVERTHEFRDGGQNVDVRGAGREVLRRMGLEQVALARGTGEAGTTWVDQNGKVVAAFLTDESSGEGPTAEMEILRGDLARLLYEPATQHAKYRFGDSIRRIDDNARTANVTFANGATETYDLIVIAEGVGSQTRERVFPGENEPRWMDLTIAYFTIARVPDDNRMWRWYNAPGGRSISLRPDNHGTTRATLTIQRASIGEDEWDSERQKTYLHDLFADAGWQADRVLTGMDSTHDFYFDALRQVRMKRWSKGRIVLTGDAAWCVTPLAGIGTTLAVTGAYVLAGELTHGGDIPAALKRYEHAMRPMVEDGQGVPKIGPRLMHPRSRLGIMALHGALSVASRPTIRNLATKLFAGPTKAPDLSGYPKFS